ncbi:hypothetical protein SAMD00019534_042980 [Acytostelium subglobosum LB1]|uniref:hypothetical protein n=1 Tax=Acytostelium subglobosum LB1 TaxID=1410327 RepID=UPI0006447FD1|nr:hypothetical protein SAMD00019534_042980 [Acytostelium subglobosum LB1]GAM21123.1 hypothetical protein SAMD00019534_042980 [Acytostelium subglobosum LB1]|eukprot:XP_012756257.1 hypothetical protein SAMD00019534_042980 [Acytostelium subglobosum LB1]
MSVYGRQTSYVVILTLLVALMFCLLISHVEGDPAPNPEFPIYSKRRSVVFIGWMKVFSQDKDVSLTVLHNIIQDPSWRPLRNGKDLFQRDRIRSSGNTTTFSCVISYDSGMYHFKQIDPLNTGYNIQSGLFNLTVQGNDTKTLLLDREPSTRVVTGDALQTQPIVSWGITNTESRGRIEPFIVSAPESSTHYITFSKIDIDRTAKTTTFQGLAIVGDEGEYSIGFVDSDTCEIVLVSQPIEVVVAWPSLITIIVVSMMISLCVFVLGLAIRLFMNHARHNIGNDSASSATSLNYLKSFQMSILVKNIDEFLDRRGSDSLHIYFKSIRLFIIFTIVQTVLGLALLIPLSIIGNNSLFEIYILTQSNWQYDSSKLYIYQALVVVVFVSFILLYSRFNTERIYNQHDRNHLVASRTVLLDGLPKSMIDCTLLREYVQNSYSKGIFSLALILDKHFSSAQIERDLDGFTDGFTKDLSADINNKEVISSTGRAFITFSCVSDAHLFQTQFSPHKWTWIKSIAPIPPSSSDAELQIKKWRAYQVPRVSDIMWTKLHSLSGQHRLWRTILQVFISIILFMSISFAAVLLHDSQFERLNRRVYFKADYSRAIHFLVYTFLPCNILLFLNRVIPCIIKQILVKSRIFVRSSLKSKILLTTFYAQALSIVFVPSFYFVIMMGSPVDDVNIFFSPANFFRTGGFFYSQFIIYYAIVTPFLDKSRIYSNAANLLRFHRYKQNALIAERFLDLSTQYGNLLLLVMMVAIYAPLFPILYLALLLYLITKYFFDKYTSISSKIRNPPSDRLLVEPLQHCIWMIITCIAIFNVGYVLMLSRIDLIFVYGFLFIVGLGRYVPSCSKSLCYGVCDGAVMPCMESDGWLLRRLRRKGKKDKSGGGADKDINSEVNSQAGAEQTEDNSDSDDSDYEYDEQINDINSPSQHDGVNGVVMEMRDIGSPDNNKSRPTQSLRMTLDIEQDYAMESPGRSFFSFLYSSRFQLPSPKSITIHQYFSPLYRTGFSMFAQD